MLPQHVLFCKHFYCGITSLTAAKYSFLKEFLTICVFLWRLRSLYIYRIVRVFSRCKVMTPNRLRELRKRLGLTQEAFAKRVGVAPNTVARWERGEIGMKQTTERLIELLCQNTDLTKKKE